MEHGIAVAFTVLKHQLDRVKAEFSAEQYFHIGDTNMDRHYAERAGLRISIPILPWTISGRPPHDLSRMPASRLTAASTLFHNSEINMQLKTGGAVRG